MLPKWVLEELEGWLEAKRTGVIAIRFKAGEVRSLDRNDNLPAPELRSPVKERSQA